MCITCILYIISVTAKIYVQMFSTSDRGRYSCSYTVLKAVGLGQCQCCVNVAINPLAVSLLFSLAIKERQYVDCVSL